MAMNRSEMLELIGPYCCICFEPLPTEESCFVDGDGSIWDVCKPCGYEEWEMIQYCYNTGMFTPWD